MPLPQDASVSIGGSEQDREVGVLPARAVVGVNVSKDALLVHEGVKAGENHLAHLVLESVEEGLVLALQLGGAMTVGLVPFGCGCNTLGRVEPEVARHACGRDGKLRG